ncbi:MAG: hypothetical protein ACE5FT_00945 [Candidatus Nanoarchaeia archaeon]
MARYAPWDRIKKGEVVYFKDAGEAVTAKAKVGKVLQFDNYTDKELKELLEKYSERINFVNPETVHEWALKRKYCILVFLKNPEWIESFEIDKTGYGNACAWICVDSIDKLRR